MRELLEAAAQRSVSRETLNQLGRYVDFVLAENSRQNLIARSTIEQIWQRHIVDGAQLLRYIPTLGTISDVGSGAGLPGLVIAILSPQPITLIEPRRLRSEFLAHCVASLGLANVTIAQARSERVAGQYDVITARAVAAISKLFEAASHLSHPGTTWVLPKGRNAQSELEEAQAAWQGEFHLHPSVTEAEAAVVVASQVTRKGKGRG